MTVAFQDIVTQRPTKQSLALRYEQLHRQLDRPDETTSALGAWDGLRREVETWQAMVRLRFEQDTRDPIARDERDYCDALMPEATELEIAMKRRLLEPALRDTVGARFGSHAIRLWENDLTTFDPAIKGALEQEAKTASRYTEILASAEISIDGRTVNLAGLDAFSQSTDRATRHRAERLRWEFFAEHGEALDRIYDELVGIRHAMARTLGYPDFTPLGYRRMRRVDYGPTEVAAYRDEVVTHVVPLVERLMARRGVERGIDQVMEWDEAIDDAEGNPGPVTEGEALLDRASSMFDTVDGDLAAFFNAMRRGSMLDLENRPGKAGGGFCTGFPTIGMPFIFANFNGTDHDVTVFTHEMGHAFQNWMSRTLEPIDYLWPTSESAEIHSMGLEFLTRDAIGFLVGDAAAERYRRVHMIGSLRFLPYGACVDHFQHEVYGRPQATPAERHEMWRRLEQRYLPWRRYGDLDYPAKGGLWQAKLHIYLMPFYYVDYTLALCCAMQLWVRSLGDRQAALASYVALCRRGGSAAFGDLVDGAGLRSPFAPGALSSVVAAAERSLA